MNILVYDDHKFVTEAIFQFISKQNKANVTATCNTIDEVKEVMSKNKVDILVSDLLSNEDAGFTLIEFIFKNYPETKIIIYSSVTSEFIIDALLDMGVSKFVNKIDSLDVLWENIEEIYENIEPVHHKYYQSLRLTKREKEIVSLLSQGLAAKEIANILGSSPNTINNQKNALLEKFNCLNSIDLVVKLSQMGLIGII
ncbi:MAG TPA: response regulator transcription factor [Saprospiraceae bacterium]|nr:response regulator transcription factor [Saprospiraceae bacterium]